MEKLPYSSQYREKAEKVQVVDTWREACKGDYDIEFSAERKIHFTGMHGGCPCRQPACGKPVLGA
jgi:hypothetical protein